MKKCMVIVACLAFVLLSGCNRCGMWDWYNPCDLVEGQAERQCGPCAPQHRRGQVVRREIAIPAEAAVDPLPAPDALAPVMIEEEAVLEVVPAP